jgi:hypothetical protein
LIILSAISGTLAFICRHSATSDLHFCDSKAQASLSVACFDLISCRVVLVVLTASSMQWLLWFWKNRSIETRKKGNIPDTDLKNPAMTGRSIATKIRRLTH